MRAARRHLDMADKVRSQQLEILQNQQILA